MRGTIPRFGEAVLEVPVTISTMRVALQAYGMMRDGNGPEKLQYKLKGKLGGSCRLAVRAGRESRDKHNPLVPVRIPSDPPSTDSSADAGFEPAHWFLKATSRFVLFNG